MVSHRSACGAGVSGGLWVYLALSLSGHALLGLVMVHGPWLRSTDESGLRVVLVTPTPPPERSAVLRPPEAALSPKIQSPAPRSRVAPALLARGPWQERAPDAPATEPEPSPRRQSVWQEPLAPVGATPGGTGETAGEGASAAGPPGGTAVELRDPSPTTSRSPGGAEGPSAGRPTSGFLPEDPAGTGWPPGVGSNPLPGSGGGGEAGERLGTGPGDARAEGVGRSGGGLTGDSDSGSAAGGDPRVVLALIRQRIERAKVYPPAAREAGIQGEVLLRFRLGPDGAVLSVQVIRSSGSAILDRASEQTVARGAPYPYFPGWIRLPLSFRLDGR